ncbi:MAG: M3 family oligoendopeptidase [Anaerolineae bacterium]|nr:M3 family oligoendopeptidase [Anaerolineae bacterium]
MAKFDRIPRWDLSGIFPGLESAEFAQAMAKLKAALDELERYIAAHQIAQSGQRPDSMAELIETVEGYLARMNAVEMLYSTLWHYAYGHVTTDSYSAPAKRAMSEVQVLGARIESQAVLFCGWMGVVTEDPGVLPALLEGEGLAREHAFYLRETAEQSRYLMSGAEESLASELALSGAKAWQSLQGVITSQLKIPFEQDGEVRELPFTVLLNLRTHPDGEVRRRAYKAELQAWKRVQEPLAACLNGVKGAVTTLYRRRGRTDALHEALDLARIDRETLEAMLGAMREAFPQFCRYWQAKAGRLGKEQLAWWDLWAPVGEAERRYTFVEARDFILAQFAAFSDRLVAFARRAFDQHWIDAEPRDGKRGGAFCMEVLLREESRILCNFDGSLDAVMTIAHELGHGYHNECLRGKTALQRQTPMTLAETASTFCQTIIADAALEQAASPGEELVILESFLLDASQAIVDIYSRYIFEKKVFERRAGAELSADELCEIMTRCQQEAYGAGVDPRYLHPYMWTWKPHYYRPALSFYNFPYAFGLLFSLGLYRVYRERGGEFLAQYDALLRDTGEARPADLAARFGFDLRQPDFWRQSLQVVEKRVEQYQALQVLRLRQ